MPNAFLEETGIAGERWTCFFASFAPYPDVPNEVVLLSYGGTDKEAGINRLRYGGSRNFAFLVERMSILSSAWPATEPISAPSYLVRVGRFVAMAPSIDPRWAPDVPANAPVGRIVGSGETQEEASALALALGVRAFIGRVELIIYCETGGEIGGFEKKSGELTFGW